MTIVTVDGMALAERLEPLFTVIFFFAVWFFIHMLLKIVIETCDSNKKRKRLQEAKQLYTARKRRFEDNPKGWKLWRDANYKITDLVEEDSYYGTYF